MYVPLIRWPGSTIVGEDQNVVTLLSLMVNHLQDGAAALHLFWTAVGTPAVRDAKSREHSEQLRRVQERVEQTKHFGGAEASEETRAAVELAAHELAWTGEHDMPGSWHRRLPRMYAHSFLYALDGILRTLRRLKRTPSIEAIEEQFRRTLPDVQATRDSAHHSDERALGLAREKVIDVEPLEFFGGATMVVGHLLGNTLVYTNADGRLGSVEVAPATLAIARRTVQQAIDAFRWVGAPRVTPSPTESA